MTNFIESIRTSSMQLLRGFFQNRNRFLTIWLPHQPLHLLSRAQTSKYRWRSSRAAFSPINTLSRKQSVGVGKVVLMPSCHLKPLLGLDISGWWRIKCVSVRLKSFQPTSVLYSKQGSSEKQLNAFSLTSTNTNLLPTLYCSRDFVPQPLFLKKRLLCIAGLYLVAYYMT